MYQAHRSAVALLLFLLSACSSYEPRETILDDVDKAPSVELYTPKTELERQAYDQGVQQVLADMKGKMRARDRFNWDKPIVECGVEIPAHVSNGSLIPTHTECIQIAPGQWTEESPTYLPVLGDE